MPITRELSRFNDRMEGTQSEITEEPLIGTPPDWSESAALWRTIVATARQFASCRPAYFRVEECEETVERLFNHLVATVEKMQQGDSLQNLRRWLRSPVVRMHPDARRLRNLMALIDELEIF